MTKSGNDNEFNKMTFSQREGKVPLPEPMRLGHIPHRFRQDVLEAILGEIEREKGQHLAVMVGYYNNADEGDSELEQSTIMTMILGSFQRDVLGKYDYQIIKYSYEEDSALCKACIEEGQYHEVLTLVEYILQHGDCPENLRNGLKAAFDAVPMAYFIEEIDGYPTILPQASLESGKATQQAIKTLDDADMGGATTHLREAAEYVTARKFADSVRHSISAVESVACRIVPNSNTLGPALNALENKYLLTNKQLKAGFEKIYAYTNSEEGIRHALVSQDSSDVGLDEAIFMFGACASFTAYLASKNQKMKQGDNES